MAFSMAPFCLLCQDDLNKVQHDIFVPVMPGLTASIAPLHLLIKNDQNKMQFDFSVI